MQPGSLFTPLSTSQSGVSGCVISEDIYLFTFIFDLCMANKGAKSCLREAYHKSKC